MLVPCPLQEELTQMCVSLHWSKPNKVESDIMEEAMTDHRPRRLSSERNTALWKVYPGHWKKHKINLWQHIQHLFTTKSRSIQAKFVGHVLRQWVHPARDESGRQEAQTTAQSNTYSDPQTAVMETLWLPLLGRSLWSTMECVDEEGSNLIPFSKGCIVTCNSSFTRDGQTISLKAERYSLSLGWISGHKIMCCQKL